MAAAVAAATWGFAGDRQSAKGDTFTMGRWSITEAIGSPSPKARLVGSTLSVDGAIP
jgi:hypothetical protein